MPKWRIGIDTKYRHKRNCAVVFWKYSKSLSMIFKNNSLPILTLFMLVIILLSSVGCNSIDKALSHVIPLYTYAKIELSVINITSDIDSNDNMPVAIDFVFIYNKSVDQAVMTLSVPEWFSNKAELLMRYQKDLAVAHVEIVPLTLNQTVTLPEGYDEAVRVLMFASFHVVSGQIVTDLTQNDQVHITLKKEMYLLK